MINSALVITKARECDQKILGDSTVMTCPKGPKGGVDRQKGDQKQTTTGTQKQRKATGSLWVVNPLTIPPDHPVCAPLRAISDLPVCAPLRTISIFLASLLSGTIRRNVQPRHNNNKKKPFQSTVTSTSAPFVYSSQAEQQ